MIYGMGDEHNVGNDSHTDSEDNVDEHDFGVQA